MNIKKIIHFSLGPILGAILGFITLPITAWFFSVEDIGRIAIFNVVMGFFVMLFSLGLDQAYVREYHESTDKALLWRTSFFPGFMLFLILSCFAVFYSEQLSIYIFSIDSIWIGIVIILCILFSYCIRYFSLILRMEERGLAFSMSQILPKIIYLSMIILAIILLFNPNLELLIFSTFFSLITVFILFAWCTRNEWGKRSIKIIDILLFQRIFKYSIPLFFSGLAYWGINSLDRMMIKQLATLGELGVFSVAMSLASVAFIVQSIFSVIWAPTVYKWIKSGQNIERVFDMTKYITLVIVLLFSLTGLFSWIIQYLLPVEYMSIRYNLAACLSIPLFYTLSETTVIGINITKKTSYALLATLLALIVSIILNFLFIPILGATGAIIGNCLVFYIFFILRTELSCFVWKGFPRLKIYLLTLTVVLLAISMALFEERAQVAVMVCWGLLFIYAITRLWFLRHEIIKFGVE